MEAKVDVVPLAIADQLFGGDRRRQHYGRGGEMTKIVMISAGLLALVGFFAGAASPSPSDHLAGKVLIAIAFGFALLAWFAPPKVTAWIYFGSIAIVVVAYSLPMSFWRGVGLAKEQPQQRESSKSPTDDN